MPFRPILFALFSLTANFALAIEADCLPKPTSSEMKSWPVCAIYMHGLFGSAPYSPNTWEIPFRVEIEKVARAKQCRVAFPIGDKGKY